MPETASISSRLREKPLWVLVGVVALYFAPVLFLDRTLYMRDLSNWAFPQRSRLVELWKESGLPLRDPFIHGGQPFLGNPNNAALYPTGLLGFVLDSVTATNLEIVLHFVLCAAGAYLLGRSVGLGKPAAFVSGAAFAFAGPTLSLGCLFNRVLAMPHLALLLLFWHLWLTQRRRLWFALAAASGALMILAGSPETLLLTLGLALAWTLAVDPLPAMGAAPRVRGVLALATLALAVAALTAVQTLPARKVVERSARSAMTAEAAATWSLHPRRLPEMAFEGLFGRTDTLDERGWWGTGVEDVGYPYLSSIYLGATVLLLAVMGLSVAGKGPLRRLPWALALAAALSIVLALGRFLPAYPALYALLPPLRLFRYPEKFLLAATLPLALLAGFGVEALLARGSERPRLPRPMLAGVILLLAAAAVLFAGAPEMLLLQPTSPEILDGIARGLMRTAALVAVTAVLVALAGRLSGQNLGWILSALVVVDLAAGALWVNPSAPREWIRQEPTLARSIRSEVGDGRLFPELLPSSFHLRAPTRDAYWIADWQREVLGNYTAAGVRIPIVFHPDFDGLVPERLLTATNFVRSIPWERRLPLLSAASVRVFVSADAVTQPSIRPLGQIPNRSDRPFFAYANDAAAPREALVSDWIEAPSARVAVAAVTDPAFDPRRTVVLESRGGPAPARCEDGTLKTLERTVVRTVVEVEAACLSFVVFSEPWDEGWRASVDGVVRGTAVANLLFTAVHVPPGRHKVALSYRPASVRTGLIVSLASLLALAAFVLTDRRASRARHDSTIPRGPDP